MSKGNDAPIGHSVSAHRVLGWCSHCRDHGVAEEIIAWRTRAGREPGIDETVREYVDRDLAEAPPGSVVEIVVTSNTHVGPLRIGTYTFEKPGP